MSKEEVSRFLCELAADSELQLELVRLAAGHGFSFEVEELREFFLEAAIEGRSAQRPTQGAGTASSP